MIVFTFFDLVGDILRNHIALAIVGEYLLNLTPSMLYQIAPLAVLIAVLVTFGVLNRNSEIVAMKATGISLYRLVIPIVSIAAILAVCLFLFDQYYLPQANRRQEALRNIIKGRPPQTYLQSRSRQWIFGRGRARRAGPHLLLPVLRSRHATSSPISRSSSSIPPPSRSRGASLPRAPSGMTIPAAWHFENGWVRDIRGRQCDGVPHVPRRPRSPRFTQRRTTSRKKSWQSQEMNFGQLDRYIRDLRQSGFDTMRLRVALWHKLAYPLVAVVMALLAIPFALSMGRRGSLTGIAVAIAVALAYWVVDGLFGAMGNVNYLPAAVAAWSADVLFGAGRRVSAAADADVEAGGRYRERLSVIANRTTARLCAKCGANRHQSYNRDYASRPRPPLQLHAPLPLGIRAGARWPALPPILSAVQFPQRSGQWPSTASSKGTTRERILIFAVILVGHQPGQRHLSLRPALDPDRHLARNRVRPAQRPVPQARKPGLRLLPALPHRRHHGAHDQRPECGAHAAGPGADVQRQHHLPERVCAVLHAAHQPLPHAGGAGAHAAGQHPRAVFRPQDSRRASSASRPASPISPRRPRRTTPACA